MEPASTPTWRGTRVPTARRSSCCKNFSASNYGDELKVIPNRFQRARDAHILQMDMFAVSFLQPFQITELAKTGDFERRQVLANYTLEVRNEASSGIVADLTTS